MKFASKYDYIIILVLILGFIAIYQQYLYGMSFPKMTQTIDLSVATTPEKQVYDSAVVGNVKTLYFDQYNTPVKVVSIIKSNGQFLITLSGPGVYSNQRKWFVGRAVNINDRVKIAGGISGDALVTAIRAE